MLLCAYLLTYLFTPLYFLEQFLPSLSLSLSVSLPRLHLTVFGQTQPLKLWRDVWTRRDSATVPEEEELCGESRTEKEWSGGEGIQKASREWGNEMNA